MTEKHEHLTALPVIRLVPGDVVCDDHGVRRFAAFDVEDRGVDVGLVEVWTAERDQLVGQPRSLYLTRDDLVWVALPRPSVKAMLGQPVEAAGV